MDRYCCDCVHSNVNVNDQPCAGCFGTDDKINYELDTAHDVTVTRQSSYINDWLDDPSDDELEAVYNFLKNLRGDNYYKNKEL